MAKTLEATEKRVTCKKEGKHIYIHAKPGVAVYDSRSKRRIGKGNWVEVFPTDRIDCRGEEYTIKSIEEKYLLLERA